MNDPSCGTCRYFEGSDSATYTAGECRRYPPVISRGAGAGVSAWPQVEPRHWCGEYKDVDGYSEPE